MAYTYDDSYQLTGEVRTGGNAYSQVFHYDSSGNRTKKTLGGTDTVYVYNNADQLTSQTTGGTTTTYEYDANGALTKSDDGTTVNGYTYDYDGYLRAFDTTGTDNDATYTYDADKRRIAKTVDSATTKYFLDGADVIADYDGDNVLLATYLTPGLDANLSQTRSGSTYYYMKDGLGSIRTLTDASEDPQNVYDYYAFGKELGSWTENVTNRYTYTAREYDPESAQYYYRARYYKGSGRFLSRDSKRNPETMSPYAYVRNSPPGYSDPSGWNSERGWFDNIVCTYYETLIGVVLTGHSDTAWNRFISGAGGNIDLSQTDMDEVLTEYKVREKILAPLITECHASTTPWTRTADFDPGGHGSVIGDPRWIAALGGVNFNVVAKCGPCPRAGMELSWTVTINDEWDFDNYRSGVKHWPRNIEVAFIKLINWGYDCGWKNFWHRGSSKGTD